MRALLKVLIFLFVWWKRMFTSQSIMTILDEESQQEPRKPVNKEKLVPLSKYCAHTTGDVVIHRDLNRWYCVFDKDGVEVIDSKEIYVDLGPGCPNHLDLQIKSQVSSIAEVVVVTIARHRISEALTPVNTTRKRFELPKESRLLDYLFVEVTE